MLLFQSDIGLFKFHMNYRSKSRNICLYYPILMNKLRHLRRKYKVIDNIRNFLHSHFAQFQLPFKVCFLNLYKLLAFQAVRNFTKRCSSFSSRSPWVWNQLQIQTKSYPSFQIQLLHAPTIFQSVAQLSLSFQSQAGFVTQSPNTSQDLNMES